MNLDSYIILQYIKSSVDIILNLKFEEIEKRLVEQHPSKMNSSRMGDSRRTDKENRGGGLL